MKIESSSEESIQIQLAKQTFTNGIFGGSTKINSKRAINIDSNYIKFNQIDSFNWITFGELDQTH